MAISEEEIDRYIESLIGSMAIEDIVLSDKDIADCKAILRGEGDVDQMVRDIIAEDTQDTDNKKRKAN